ncbi:uncharacterized protein G2W53_035098 [Senna tora]|uniref:Uncharacterized protein n=1 Tax=Senna tora TaxID=362788 RepID=A0A834W3T9_9FABA|nr:uncharacterized protein G2W53_035098 [Senna tora]
MDQRYWPFLYRDGNICQGSNGVAFEGQQPLGVIIREVSLSPLLYGALYLQNDEHMEMMTMTHNLYVAVINVMELLVETREVRFLVNLNVESQPLLEDVPSSIPFAYYQCHGVS